MSTITDYVAAHPLFCHHDHHHTYAYFDAGRDRWDYASLLGYADADLAVAEGARPPVGDLDRARIARHWPAVRFTGYGRAVTMGCRALFGLEFEPENFDAITAALQDAIRGRTAAEVYDDFVHQRADNVWTIHDGIDPINDHEVFDPQQLPDSYRSVFRMDSLLDMVDAGPIQELEAFTGRAIYTLDDLVAALNVAIDRVRDQGRLAAIKIGMAYGRDLMVADPTRYEAERAFNAIRSRKLAYGGRQQNNGAVDAAAGRPLGDYMFHAMMQRAHAEDLPVQIHTGYLAGMRGALAGTRAMNLLPVIEKYRTVRFDLFHASWPWTSEMGAIGKNYPNVWLDMCWAWTMNPTQCERALDEWLDAVPFTKIFGYGADTGLPWCNMGYSLQARQGIARVLERKTARGDLSAAAACEIADRIMLDNGVEFYGLG